MEINLLPLLFMLIFKPQYNPDSPGTIYNRITLEFYNGGLKCYRTTFFDAPTKIKNYGIYPIYNNHFIKNKKTYDNSTDAIIKHL